MKVDVLDIDRRGKGFERAIVEAVQRGHEPEILCNPLGERLGERKIVDGESHIMAEQLERLELTWVIAGATLPLAKRHYAHEFATHFQRRKAVKQLWRHISIGTQ